MINSIIIASVLLIGSVSCYDKPYGKGLKVDTCPKMGERGFCVYNSDCWDKQHDKYCKMAKRWKTYRYRWPKQVRRGQRPYYRFPRRRRDDKFPRRPIRDRDGFKDERGKRLDKDERGKGGRKDKDERGKGFGKDLIDDRGKGRKDDDKGRKSGALDLDLEEEEEEEVDMETDMTFPTEKDTVETDETTTPEDVEGDSE